MKKIFVILVSLTLVFSFLMGCSEDSQPADDGETSTSSTTSVSSVVSKDEAELVLEQTLWQIEGAKEFLLFYDGKQVSEYDLDAIDGENQEVEKPLSYAIETGKNSEKIIYFPYLIGKHDFRLTYHQEDKTFTAMNDEKISMKQVSMKSFMQQFMQQIAKAETDGGNQWQTQAEMNIGSAVICNYWNTLFDAIDRYLQATLSQKEYQDFAKKTKNFETSRDAAMQEAGKEVEGGSMYVMVTNGAYSTATQKQIQTILTEYFE